MAQIFWQRLSSEPSAQKRGIVAVSNAPREQKPNEKARGTRGAPRAYAGSPEESGLSLIDDDQFLVVATEDRQP